MVMSWGMTRGAERVMPTANLTFAVYFSLFFYLFIYFISNVPINTEVLVLGS